MAVFHQVPVLVPLEVADVVLAQQCVDAVEDVLPGVRVDEVDDVLVPPLQRQAPAVLVRQGGGPDDPLRVRPGNVGVQVDHLRFHPEPELHPARSHGLDQRREPVGPERFVHVPVAQAGVVVAAPAEPAVVEHKTLDAQFGGGIRQFDQRGQVVVEVDRFPGVEDHRAGLAGAGGRCRGQHVVRAGPEPAVERLADAVQAAVRVGREECRGGVASARCEDRPRPGPGVRSRRSWCGRRRWCRRTVRGCRSRPGAWPRPSRGGCRSPRCRRRRAARSRGRCGRGGRCAPRCPAGWGGAAGGVPGTSARSGPGVRRRPAPPGGLWPVRRAGRGRCRRW